ncbi:D-amino-acid transaminase [Camelimonas fluminis]|uniref:Probable branched-chain-amino-acid aminotransferase n=1 Tax=Camelimonas fluminis TaxID=1576911 RepID=A0ABV7UJW5_9HYPH|nr:D-amino-acid transaminase [Camelimonas fluminis]GHE58656.1 D-amino-acid transaminase [Camelimonas fluminis]
MSRVAWVNGRFRPRQRAAIPIDDRAVLFADSVYEVCEVFGGALVDLTAHLDRLDRSLRELAMAAPMGRRALTVVMRETARRNRVRDGMVYVQVSRGAAPRDFLFPDPPAKPTLIVTARSIDRAAAEARAVQGMAVITTPDIRWGRVDIKTTGLLPNVLAKEAARLRGAREAWLTDRDGFITEGGSSNAWIITQAGVLVTRPADGGILRGVTRGTLLRLVQEMGLPVEERAFTRAEALAAREAFVTAATTLVAPVIRIDDEAIGDGRPGALTLELRRRLHDVAEMAA